LVATTQHEYSQSPSSIAASFTRSFTTSRGSATWRTGAIRPGGPPSTYSIRPTSTKPSSRNRLKAWNAPSISRMPGRQAGSSGGLPRRPRSISTHTNGDVICFGIAQQRKLSRCEIRARLRCHRHIESHSAPTRVHKLDPAAKWRSHRRVSSRGSGEAELDAAPSKIRTCRRRGGCRRRDRGRVGQVVDCQRAAAGRP